MITHAQQIPSVFLISSKISDKFSTNSQGFIIRLSLRITIKEPKLSLAVVVVSLVLFHFVIVFVFVLFTFLNVVKDMAKVSPPCKAGSAYD